MIIMIGFFPDPYPDELFYSACARYAQRLDYPNKQSVITELFGRRGLSAIVDFPTRLKYFLSVIRTNKYSAEEIINKNTLFPFYEPFITVERAEFIRKEMKKLSDNHIGARLAININQINLPKFLRFCPLCVKSDKVKFGETFWHRLHQLAGVFVCPEHLCFLENSQIKWERESSGFFHAAEDFVTSAKAHFLDQRKTAHKVPSKNSRKCAVAFKSKEVELEKWCFA